MKIVVMGVAGSGKTTVGRQLAQRLGLQFVDADDHHSAENIEKMRSGIPLTDADRIPWLHSLADRLAEDDGIVLACSALRSSYRQILSSKADVRFVFLKAERELIDSRMDSREGHYMPASLVESQFADLEEPLDAITLDASLPADSIVTEIERLVVDVT